MKVLVGLVLGFVSLVSFAELPAEALRLSVEKRVEKTVRDEHTPYMHAMRAPGESVEAARSKINFWIRANFQKAFAYRSKGATEAALFHYFMARHALRDSTSPMSNDDQGNPAILDTKYSVEHKEFSTNNWRDKVDEDAQFMFDNNYVPAGDLLRMYGIDSEKGPVNRPNQTPRPKLGRK